MWTILKFTHLFTTHVLYIGAWRIISNYSLFHATHDVSALIKPKPQLSTFPVNVPILTDSPWITLLFPSLIKPNTWGLFSTEDLPGTNTFYPSVEKTLEPLKKLNFFQTILYLLSIYVKYMLYNSCILPIMSYTCHVWEIYM